MDTTAIAIMIMAVAVLNIVLLVRLSASEKSEQKPKPAGKEGISVMGKTKTRFLLHKEHKENPVPPLEAGDDTEPTEEPEDGSPEIGEEFHPETDEVDEEEVEMEELFSVTKNDIRLQGNELVTGEIARLQKIRTREDIPTEDRSEIQAAVSKLGGSEFLRLLKENEEKAEKRNRKLLKMIEAEEHGSGMAGGSVAEPASDDISLEDFL